MTEKSKNENNYKKGRDEMIAGIYFPISRIKKNMKKLKNSKSISQVAAVYLAAELEYICAEIIELAGGICFDEGKKIMSSRHIFKAISTDNELPRLFDHSIIHNGGVRQTLKIRKYKLKKTQKNNNIKSVENTTKKVTFATRTQISPWNI